MEIQISMKVMFHSLTQLTFTCSKLTIKTLEQGGKYGQSEQKEGPERRQWRRSSVFIVTLNIFYTFV